MARELIRQGEHVWDIIDDEHRACVACGLRLFLHRSRGWVLLDFFGRPNDMRLLGDGGQWGTCRPPPAGAVATVVIEYTGDPDIHPGCERIMHALAGDPSRALVGSRSAVRTVCRGTPAIWELGPSRDHPGWTWCPLCWPGELAPHEAHAQALHSMNMGGGSTRRRRKR